MKLEEFFQLSAWKCFKATYDGAYMCLWAGSALVQAMTCQVMANHLFGTKPLPYNTDLFVIPANLNNNAVVFLTHWGRVTHLCIRKLSIIGSDNGLSPGRCQAIIWNNARILLIWTLGTNFSEISCKIHAFSFKKMHLKMSSEEWRPFCLSLNVLIENALQHVVCNVLAISVSPHQRWASVCAQPMRDVVTL